jgi:hypothetical protein
LEWTFIDFFYQLEEITWGLVHFLLEHLCSLEDRLRYPVLFIEILEIITENSKLFDFFVDKSRLQEGHFLAFIHISLLNRQPCLTLVSFREPTNFVKDILNVVEKPFMHCLKPLTFDWQRLVINDKMSELFKVNTIGVTVDQPVKH